jgi:hypothetical protein
VYSHVTHTARLVYSPPDRFNQFFLLSVSHPNILSDVPFLIMSFFNIRFITREKLRDVISRL